MTVIYFCFLYSFWRAWKGSEYGPKDRGSPEKTAGRNGWKNQGGRKGKWGREGKPSTGVNQSETGGGWDYEGKSWNSSCVVGFLSNNRTIGVKYICIP